MENNEPLYFAIDSDILRRLTHIDIILESEQFYDIKNSNDPLLKKYGGYLQRLYHKMKNDEIRLVIVDAVYQESKHSESLVNFMKNYCYFPKINAVNYQEKATEARNLAYAYCAPYTMGEKQFPAPMKMIFHTDENKHAPSNDCYIMAQASIEGISLITANGKDFIFDDKSNSENHYRTNGIININISKGYYSTAQSNRLLVSRPFHIRTIGPLLTKDKNVIIETISPFNEFDKGSELIS